MKNNFGYSWRAYLIYIFLSLSLLILVFRIVSLQYIEGDFLKSKGEISVKEKQKNKKEELIKEVKNLAIYKI